MATAFMKWLERRPKDYDRGIRWLTLGQLGRLHASLLGALDLSGARVLEIGCGTGALAVAMAQRGARLTAIDLDPGMLAEAEARAREVGVDGQIAFQRMDAARIAEAFQAGAFDVVVSSLALSEMAPQTQTFVLQACRKLLASDGVLAVVDETLPEGGLARALFHAVRAPFRLITWLLTRTGTHPLQAFEARLAQASFSAEVTASRLGGTLKLYLAKPTVRPETARYPPSFLGRLESRTTLRTRLIDLWALFLRILPPYPKLKPGLYTVGEPNPDSPVLVTGNFDLTVRRLVREIDGRVAVWLLVVDSAGINVWCAAGGGYLTAERVIGALVMSGLEQVVRHRTLILPQLCANGVDGWQIRRETGWGVHWGPVRAADVPAYLVRGGVKSEAMRAVRFQLRDRLEMVTVTLGFYGLLILLPVLIFWRRSFWPILVSLVCISYVYAVVLPWLPGRDGLAKSLPLAGIVLGGLTAYTLAFDPAPPSALFSRAVGLLAVSIFVAAELQGMSPQMRGEQANWGWEAVIGVVLGLTYWLLPLAMGWR